MLKEGAESGAGIRPANRGGGPGRLTTEEAKAEARRHQTHAAYRVDAVRDASDEGEKRHAEGHAEGRAAQRRETSRTGNEGRASKAAKDDQALLDQLVALVESGEKIGDSIAAKLHAPSRKTPGISLRKLDALWKRGVAEGRLPPRRRGRPAKRVRRG